MQKRIFAIVFSFFLVVGFFLRFTHLDWGKPYFFHPDENNITTAIAGLSLHQWNPHFFAYGSLPIYATYLLTLLISLGKQPTFSTIAYTLRFISALLSFLLIPSLWYIGTKMYSHRAGYIAALLASVGTGLIQFAHFGTFELWLTFFSLWFFYAQFLFWKNPSKKHIFLLSCIGGILLGIKISSIALLLVPFLLFFFRDLKKKELFFLRLIAYISIILAVYIFTNPYIILDPAAVISALHYESSVALGSTEVFYTQSFLHTTPIIFQFLYVFPFLLNPFVLLTFLLGIFYIFFHTLKKLTIHNALLLSFFFILFFSQAFFFVKWTRYMVPCIPFMYLFIGIALQEVNKRVVLVISSFLCIISLLYAGIFNAVAYSQDSRIVASNFVMNLSSHDVLTEPYDLGIVPFLKILPKQSIIDFYSLDDNQHQQNLPKNSFSKGTIFLSLSQRIARSRLKNPIDFPLGNNFYTSLYSKREFKILYLTPCDIWCKIIYNGDPVNNMEETSTVFDHPFLGIFQKI